MNQDLTARERQVMWCIYDGLSNKVIAQDLDIAESTVKAHIHKILWKLGFTNRTQIATHAAKVEREDAATHHPNDRGSARALRSVVAD